VDLGSKRKDKTGRSEVLRPGKLGRRRAAPLQMRGEESEWRQ